jgi:hypothetical protein
MNIMNDVPRILTSSQDNFTRKHPPGSQGQVLFAVNTKRIILKDDGRGMTDHHNLA